MGRLETLTREKKFSKTCALPATHFLLTQSDLPSVAFPERTSQLPMASYSSALASKATLKWTDGNLDKWLTNPSKFAPGNAMAFAGIGSGKDRADLIAFLKGG